MDHVEKNEPKDSKKGRKGKKIKKVRQFAICLSHNPKVKASSFARLHKDFFVETISQEDNRLLTDAIEILKVSLPNYTYNDINGYLGEQGSSINVIYGFENTTGINRGFKIVFGSLFFKKTTFVDVFGFGIVPKYRNMGFGSILLQSVMDKVPVCLFPDNAAIGFYKNQGFVLKQNKTMQWKPRAYVPKHECKMKVIEFNNFMEVMKKYRHLIPAWNQSYDKIESMALSDDEKGHIKEKMIQMIDSENSMIEVSINKLFE